MTAFQNKEEIFKDLIQRASVELIPYQITEWVNAVTKKDQFTALHYASFRGSIEVCDLLIERGADYKMKNIYGLNVMHIAA